MRSTIIFMLLSCTGCLCTKCRDCESSHVKVPKVKKEHGIEVRAEKHDDTNRAIAYKNYRQYPPRKHKNDNSRGNYGP